MFSHHALRKILKIFTLNFCKFTQNFSVILQNMAFTVVPSGGKSKNISSNFVEIVLIALVIIIHVALCIQVQTLPCPFYPHHAVIVYYISFVRAPTVFADLYNFLTVWRSSALTVHTELSVNCCKTEKLLTVVQFCSSFWGIAKFTVK